MKIKMTKVVCTIGPKSESEEMLTKLVESGMNVMRLNFSHGDYEEHGARIKTIREVVKKTGKEIAILLDTKGPEIRTGKLENGEDVLLETGNKVTITTDYSFVGNAKKFAVSYPGIVNDLKVGSTVLLDDGLIGLKVESINVEAGEVECVITNTGELGQTKGVNLPDVSVGLPALAEKDINDLKFGCEQGVDFVAASFIRKAADVAEVRKVLDENGGHNIKIIPKIESQEGVDNFDEILELSDGIMVARGDLGVEVPAEEVPFMQKMMIRKCNKAGKPVITATQMLDSMIRNPRPTRAEAGDVANAILDGTDAVMLSGESAKGKYPAEAVQMMATISKRTDEFKKFKPVEIDENEEVTVTEAISNGAVRTSNLLDAKLIVCWTKTGRAARMIRKYGPTVPIIALTDNDQTARQLALVRGVRAYVEKGLDKTDDFFAKAREIAANHEEAKKGDLVVLVTGISKEGTTNTLRVERVGEK
ncbi:pyruvate kinase PykF [Leptotrichia sp. oral taxon 221]|uniref:pyruvate kinase PykF n=1 Tax=Leptotrichia sp. oral taxon 221 TaxID=712362 RepID=UPI001B8D8BD7|nr:pyruvate kinase PykF [Leptotrichia sp. oral taxon 221]QUB96532.1 pyruvate kinase PykF [Leptotrichia sp. oral taxon 221]